MVYEKPEPLDRHSMTSARCPSASDADGAIVERDSTRRPSRAAIEELVDDGVEALTVCLLNSLRERAPRARHRARSPPRVAPDLPVSISSEVLPEFREYERTVTTLMNAYVAPALEQLPERTCRDGLAAAQRRAPVCRSCAPTAA